MSLARSKNDRLHYKAKGSTLPKSSEDRETRKRSLSQPSETEANTSNSNKEADAHRTLSSNEIVRTPHMSKMSEETNKMETEEKGGTTHSDKAKKPGTAASEFGGLSKKGSSGIPLPLRHSAPVKGSSKIKTTTPRLPAATRNPLRSSTNTSLSSARPDANTKWDQAKRSMEIQFSIKKRKLEQLKKELAEKQKPVLDIYESLVSMKKDLEESGKMVALNTLKLVEFDEKGKKLDHLAGAGEIVKQPTIDQKLVTEMRVTMNQIPASLLDVCKSIMDKRAAVITLLENEPLDDKDTIMKQVDLFKKESSELEKHVEDTFASQQKQINDFLQNWQNMLDATVPPSTEVEDKLREEIATQEKTLAEITCDLQKAQLKLDESQGHKELMKAEEEIFNLQEKIAKLETELMVEKTKAQKERAVGSNNYEHKLKQLHKQVKEAEAGKARLERENDELHTRIRGYEYKLKTSEQKLTKEREEMEKRKKQDGIVYHKVSNERQHLETRVSALEDLLDKNEKEHKEEVEKLMTEVDEAQGKAIKAHEEKEIMKSKCEAMRSELVKMELHNRQAVDLVNNRKQFSPNECDDLSTEKEVQLYTELLATKVALRSSQDKLEQYSREKLRFISSIEQLNGNVDKNKQNIAKALLIKEEEISRLIHEKNEYEDNITKQKLEISSLQMSVNNLEERIRALQMEAQKETDQELKKSLQEGRLKLEQALKRSLENEQRLLKFEYEIEQKTKQLNQMENLLQVRDGLIGMIKTKKDELTLENESLNEYAEQVRTLLIQSREENNQRDSVIQDLQKNLDLRSKTVQNLEQRVKELEGALSATNEKRYKLQDTIGTMEKELQSTKAHVNQMADLQTRYAPTGQDINFSDLGDGPVRIKISVS